MSEVRKLDRPARATSSGVAASASLVVIIWCGRLDPTTGRQLIEVRTRQRIEAGDELLNCYDFGEPLAPELFLTRYGFVPGETVGSFVDSLAGKGRLPFGFKLDV